MGDKSFTTKEGIKIYEAALLSGYEAMKTPVEIRKYKNNYWLREAGAHPYYSMFVYEDGLVGFLGIYTSYDKFYVRPSLIISDVEESGLSIGDKFVFGGKTFQIIYDTIAFCLEDIGRSCFRRDYKAEFANEYEKSDIKKFVDGWFNKAKA